MLREVPEIAQDAPGLNRRWFRDEYFDLFLWEKPGGEIAAFQLCYDRADRERSLRWSSKSGFLHEGVDRPESKPGRSMTAILVVASAFPATAVSRKFLHATQAMPSGIRDFLLDRLRMYTEAIARPARARGGASRGPGKAGPHRPN